MRFAHPAALSCSRFATAVVIAAVVAGCASGPPRGGQGTTLPRDADGPGANPPADLASLPDAEPRIEPIRSGGPNKPYQVLGHDYVPATRDVPFSERGLASWYGRKFHGRPTASGEVYDMYAMTAAHPTLPIPSYARIRNPANGREVVVRINDRGPFHPGRIVDLSYAAALRLDLLRGVAPVELERFTFDDIRTGAWRGRGGDATRLATAPTPADAAVATVAATAAPSSSPPVPVPAQDVALVAAAPTSPAPDPPAASIRPATQASRGFWVQLGAFRERDGAESFRRRIGADDDAGWLAPMLAVFADSPLYRVQAGPFANRDEAEGAALRLRTALALVPLIVERR
jgi:peptidoglycan lytic transglycosylase